MLDLKIVGGTVVDGTGAPGVRADVGVRDGRIVAVGQIDEDARQTVDATGRIVAPGFVDAHTHYDAQVFWDPKLSPSCYHGVTTVMAGFCGFSIAPITPEAADYIMPMLARVEGMPLETLKVGVPWNWRSFGEYLAAFEGRIGLNAGFFAGHSPIRRIVMGERAVGEKATPEDIAAMQALLGKSIEEGAMGFSTSIAATHNDGDGNPVPSRWASHDEIVALASVVKDYEGTALELLPDVDFGPGIAELMADVSKAGNRPLNWNVLAIIDRPDMDEQVERQLNISNFARERGAEVIALTVPATPEVYINLRTGVVFDALPGKWREIFKWSVEERMAKLRDPAFRKQLAHDAVDMPPGAAMEMVSKLPHYMVVATEAAANKAYEGRRIADIAAEEGREPIDVMLDISLADDLNTVFSPDFGANDRAAYELRGRLWADDRTLIGASDAGAHLDMIDTFSYSTRLLEKGVREFGVISLEQAIHKITQRPAEYFGLIDRGLISEGYHADLVVFDAATVRPGLAYNRFDVPGGDEVFRIYADAIGVDHVFVNGTQIVSNGEHTGALPGSVIRSGKDTRTVPLNAMRDKVPDLAAAE